jgi:hypothetical protein
MTDPTQPPAQSQAQPRVVEHPTGWQVWNAAAQRWEWHPRQPAAPYTQPAAAQQMVVMGGGRWIPTNHLLHLILTVFTCGLWAPVWLVVWLINRNNSR